MADIYDAYPHGELTEVFTDIWCVTGTSKPNYDGTVWQFSRVMTVVRHDGALTIVNSIRLDDAGLAALDALGKVEHVVRLGNFHGMDDKFYIDRYGAKQWALEGMEHEHGQPTDHVLGADGQYPFPGASLFLFETSKQPEGLLVLERDGGIVIACDSLQNWAEVDKFFDEETGQKMTQFGFIQPANIGPGWKRASSPGAADFERLSKLSFENLLPAHGTPIKGGADAQFKGKFEHEISGG